MKGITLGALIGGVLGGAMALLLATKGGKKMRKDLLCTYERIADDAQEIMEEMCDRSIELADKAKEIVEVAKSTAKKCKRRCR